MAKMRGQIFAVGAIIFSSLILIAGFTFLGSNTSQESSLQPYFKNIISSQTEIFNEQLKENNSIEEVKKDIYKFNKFTDIRTSNKGLEFEAFQLILFSDKEKALFINYRDTSTDFGFGNPGETSKMTIESLENLKKNIKSKNSKYRLNSSELNLNRTFEFGKTRMVSFVRIENNNQIWQNNIVR